ncbi:MAG: AraC family transcriptional regulator [Sphingobacteriaceae bacterium]|nr:AraC family transcriptional regulator [Cytophagaceae bacterium]
MKPVLEHLPLEAKESFVVKHFDYPYYPTPWHYHPEYEIVLVTESRGKRFIGDRITNFEPGDLAFIGPNLPHLYRNEPEYYEEESRLRSRSIVVHFLTTSLGSDLLSLPEAENLKRLLDRSVRGLHVTGEANAAISRLLHEMVEVKGFPRLLKLLEVLSVLAESSDWEYISSPGVTGHNERDSDRLNRVFEFVMQEFHREIRIAEVADLIHMSETAFSRYFRQRTRKTFSEFLSEIRLGHASKLLLDDKKSVSEICYESGFNNLSNFNRQFRAFYNTSPLAFKKLYFKR